MARFVGCIETAHGALSLGGRTLVMGVLNVTPDSFSDGGRYVAPAAAINRAEQMAAEGADLIDIGGESTRPGAAEVEAAEQIRRVLPVIEGLRTRQFGLPISIDTRSAAVAEAALAAGADILNDVSGLTHDAAMTELVIRTGAPLVLMHMRGTPATMQAHARYSNITYDLQMELGERLASAEEAGVDMSRVIVDPGIGFGKTSEHNWAILRGLAALHEFDRPLLVGVSRKRFIREQLGVQEPTAAAFGTAAAVAACCMAGAQIVRVHDVREMRQVVDICAAIIGIAVPGGSERGGS